MSNEMRKLINLMEVEFATLGSSPDLMKVFVETLSGHIEKSILYWKEYERNIPGYNTSLTHSFEIVTKLLSENKFSEIDEYLNSVDENHKIRAYNLIDELVKDFDNINTNKIKTFADIGILYSLFKIE